MAFPKRFSDLCAPAQVYFGFSMAAILLLLFQNMGNKNSIDMGNFSCRVPSTFLFLFIKLIYVIFWTWVLNLICRDGYTGVSWFIVLVPWILVLMMIGLVAINK